MIFKNKLTKNTFFAFAVLLMTFTLPVFAAELQGSNTPKYKPVEITKMLKEGGYVIYFRHAATEKVGEKIVSKDKLADCSQQRNLSKKGLDQAKMIGKAFKDLEIPVGNVYSSPYCRTVDTAELAFGKHIKSDNLHFAIHLPKNKRGPVSEKLRDMLGQKPVGSENTVIVSHTGNLKEAVGIWPRIEGEAHIFKPDNIGNFTYLGLVKANGWM